jgi:pimeloyl-ACP methyl ester carboxylesterase
LRAKKLIPPKPQPDLSPATSVSDVDSGIARFPLVRPAAGDAGRNAIRLLSVHQRPLRSVLMRYAGPLLIIHGSTDPMVPIQAAREHHRMVPLSELIVLDGSHFMVFERPTD